MHANTGKMPAGVKTLYGVQSLSTFSYAMLYSTLALHLTNTLHFTQGQSNALIGLFIAANFTLHLLAGYLGDNTLSKRSLFVISTLIEIMGLFFLSQANSQTLYLGLSLFLIGCGINSTCLKCLLTEQFQAEDEQRETAFFMSYCASNIGFFVGFIASGCFDRLNNYPALYEIGVVTSTLALFAFASVWKHFKSTGIRYKPYQGGLIILACLPLLYVGLQHATLANDFIIILGIFMGGFILYLALTQANRLDKNKLIAFLILAVFSVVFWTVYYIGPMGFTFYLKNNTNTYCFGLIIPPQWIMNLNTILIIAGSPLCIVLFNKLRDQGLIISIAWQFWLSLLAIALSYFVLAIGIYYADDQGFTHLFWIVAHYLFQATGELLIGPVGYAMIGKLIPKRLQGIMMGFWMMVSGIAAALSHHFSVLMTRSESINPLLSNADFFTSFYQLGICAVVVAIALTLLIPKLDNYMGGNTTAIKESDSVLA